MTTTSQANTTAGNGTGGEQGNQTGPGNPGTAPPAMPTGNDAQTGANANPQPPPPPPPPAAYAPKFFDGTLPAATGDVAKTIASRATTEEQRNFATTLYDFLSNPQSSIADLNHDNRPFTALVSVPGENKVKVVYGIGLGTARIGEISPIANKLLVLFGEGGKELGTPQVLTLTKDLTEVKSIANPTDLEVETAFASASHSVEKPVARASNVGQKEDIMKIAPIPTYMVYDGFEDDLDAGMVYERLRASQHDSPMKTHALAFLRSCMVGPWTQTHEKPFTPTEEFFKMQPRQARTWAKNRFQQVFPELMQTTGQEQQPVQQQQEQTTATGNTTAEGQGPVFNLGIDAIRQLIMQANSNTAARHQEEKKEEKVEFKISEFEKARMKVMCGLPSRCGDDAFPRWYRHLFEKHQEDKDRELLIKQVIETTKMFEDADVPLYPALLKMIIKRNWTASDIGKRSSFVNAAKGLSPFAMLDLTEDDIAVMKQDYDDIDMATSVTAAEFKQTRTKLLATVPCSSDKFMRMMKRYANLLFALFGSQCPLYKELYAVIKALREFSETALANMTHEVKASILWITLLQSRKFAQGLMTGEPEGELWSFRNMKATLKEMNCSRLSHDEMPDELRFPKQPKEPKSKRKLNFEENQEEEDKQPTQGPRKRKQEEPWHPVLQEALLQPLKDAGWPAVGKICQYCGIANDDLLPDFDKRKDCRQFMVMGRCNHRGCRFKHKTATDKQAAAVTEKFKRFINEPLGLKEDGCDKLLFRHQPEGERSTSPAVVIESSSQPPSPMDMKTPEPHHESCETKHASTREQHSIFEQSTKNMTIEEQKGAIAEVFAKEDTKPKEEKMETAIGKIPSLVVPRFEALQHAAGKLLEAYASKGCPVNCGPDWSREHIEASILRGPHPTAHSIEALQALHDETEAKVKNGYSRLVRYGDIRKNLPRNLKISPVAMIPHKSRAFRTILDLSFKLRLHGKLMQSVNSATVKQAPAEAMVQLGNCIQRLVALLADNFDPAHPFKFAKLDIKDGFWRMAVNPDDAWNFCYVLPQFEEVENIDDVILVVPNCLQMGWCESPPFFCASSETARDVIMTLLQEQSLPEHRFEDKMMADAQESETEHRLRAAASFVNLTEVFVDDFIGATNQTDPSHLRHFSRAMLHGIHAVFPPPEVTGHNGEDPISQKKLKQGEGTWETTKEILGWLVDGAKFTIQLMPDKCEKIVRLIRKICKQSKCPLKKYQELAGKLQHASFAIPGGKGLFSPVHRALKTTKHFVAITPDLKRTLQDWSALVQHLRNHPTPVQLLVSEYPNYIEYTDACKLGAGGVITPGLDFIQHIVWQYPWPMDIQQQLVSESNPSGTLTINDLELGGMILGWLVLEYVVADLTFKHVGMFCDNTSAVSWAFKGHTTTSLPAARLLRLLSIRLRERQATSLVPLSIAGKDNRMADIPSPRIMDRVPDPRKISIASDLVSAWRASADGVTAQTARTREKYWGHWTDYCLECGQRNPYLTDLNQCEKAVILCAFAARVRTGAYGKGNQVKVQSVTDAIAAISQTCKLVGEQSPALQGEAEYILPLKRVIEGFRRSDPAAIPQLAVPKDVPEKAATTAYAGSSAKQQAAADLAVVAFYYLLRSGEYTKPRRVRRNGQMVRATRTKQFRVRDIGFWKNGKILPRASPLKKLEDACAATMKISNQKNGRVGQTLHQESTGKWGGVAALGRRVYHILSNGGTEDSLICEYFTDEAWNSIESSDIVAAVRKAVRALHLHTKGIDPDLVGAHSLRAGGAMALKIMGYSDSTIQKIGRWTSDTWQMYIHSQIAKLHEGVAEKMSTSLPYHNIAFIEPSVNSTAEDTA